jgi:hypothetical protein
MPSILLSPQYFSIIFISHFKTQKMKKYLLKIMLLCLLSASLIYEAQAQKKYHYIKAQNGQYLTVEAGDYSNGVRAILSNYVGDHTQKWELASNFDRNGQYESTFLMTCSTGRKVLDIAANGTANGTPINLWDFHGGSNQRWQFEIIDGNVNGVFRCYIQSKTGRRSIDFCNPNRGMYLWEFNGGDCQKWTMIPAK